MNDELTEEERMKNLEQIIVFMDSNLELKQIFRDLAPKDIDVYKNDAIIDYFDKQYDLENWLQYI